MSTPITTSMTISAASLSELAVRLDDPSPSRRLEMASPGDAGPARICAIAIAGIYRPSAARTLPSASTTSGPRDFAHSSQ